jgi:hypothetical protein
MKTQQNTQLVAELWQMPPEELRLIAQIAAKLAALRSQVGRASGRREEESSSVRGPRHPMRPPRAGSLRETIHMVLSEAAPGALDRSEIVARAAARRGIPNDAKLAAAVWMVLRDWEHDKGINRLAEGSYCAGQSNMQ